MGELQELHKGRTVSRARVFSESPARLGCSLHLLIPGHVHGSILLLSRGSWGAESAGFDAPTEVSSARASVDAAW